MYPVTYNNYYSIERLTRPSNTTAYTVGECINDVSPRLLRFNASLSVRGGYVTRVSLATNNNAHTAAIRLWLFSSSIASTPDQVPINLSFVSPGLLTEGYVDFTTFAVPGNSTFAFSEGLMISRPMQFQAGADNMIYGVLEARAAFTPTNAQQFAVELYTEFSA